MNVKIWKITTLLFVITFCFGRSSSQDQLSFISKQEDQSSLVEPMIIFQNELYFYANSAEYGKELWKTNGTTNGTKLLKDIAPGIFSSISSSFNRNPVVMGDHLYFWANDGNSGDQVWRTDGTTENTIRVTDHPGQFKSDIVSSGNQLFYFTSRFENTLSSDFAIQLWTSDGNVFNEKMVENEFPSNGTNSIRFMLGGDSILYFANTSSNTNIWQSDGTVMGTFPITDIVGGTSPRFDARQPYTLAFFNREVYFWSFGELFKIDSLSKAIKFVKRFDSTAIGQSNVDWKVIGNHIYFLLYDEANNRQELVRSDGTEAGTEILIRNQGIINNFDSSNLLAIDKKLYYTSSNFNSNENTSLYEYDTETGGETELVSFNVFENGFFDRSFSNIRLYSNDQQIFINKFPWNKNVANFFIYDIKSNFFSEYDIVSDGRIYGSILNQEFIFRGTEPFSKFGNELYKIDSNTVEPLLIKNINESSNKRVHRIYRFETGDHFLVNTIDSFSLTTLWDRTNSKFINVPDLFFDERNRRAAQLGDKILFSYTGRPYEQELAVLNNKNLSFIADIVPGAGGEVNFLTTFKEAEVYFLASSDRSNSTNTLYRTDGTSSRTIPIFSLNLPTSFNRIVEAENYLYLSTINTGSSLYRFDPITNDTINLGVFSRINEILSVGDQVVILAQKSTFDDKQLFISDGIMPLKRFRVIEGVEEHSIDIRAAFKNKFYYTAYSKDQGYELYVGDIESNSTMLLADINVGEASSTRRSFYAKGQEFLFFTAADKDHGTELWRTDGTPLGTIMVKDINQGTCSSSPKSLYPAPNGKLYFTAFTEESGAELWVSDGTSEGTQLVNDILPGVGYSNPQFFYMPDSILYFLASDAQNVFQLYQLKGEVVSTIQDDLTSFDPPIDVYPNPVDNVIFIEISNKIQLPIHLNIFDLQGRLVKSRLINSYQSQLDISNLDNQLLIFYLQNQMVNISKRILIGK